MSKRCPVCGSSNEDTRIYCSHCGELMDADLRLMQDLQKHTSAPAKEAPPAAPSKEQPDAPRRKADDGDYEDIPRARAQEKKLHPAVWVILGLAAVAAVVIAILFL